jgi:hypothetical protein
VVYRSDRHQEEWVEAWDQPGLGSSLPPSLGACCRSIQLCRCNQHDNINHFTAKVANIKQLVDRPPKSLFGTKSHKNEHSFTYQNCFLNPYL